MSHAHPSHAAPAHEMTELDRESRMGGLGTETDTREIRRISLHDLENRRSEITDQLWSAATDIGFFQVVDHGIDAATLDHVFAMSERFFALPEDVKAQYPLRPGTNAGWEYRSQVRPSVRTPDQKESYQVTLPRMADLWPTDAELDGFRATIESFEARCRQIAMDLLSCFADRLGFDRDFFTRAHDPSDPGYQSTLRLLHYYAFPDELLDRPDIWRAGAHTDFDALTLLFQRAGQGGLQVLPGAEAQTQAWTSVEPSDDAITCNIGDMLMRWSDDLLPSNFHRVRAPRRDEYRGPRHTIAFFAQANADVVIEGPASRHEPITAADYLRARIAANFAG
ncbi:2-oxoglutarate and iron-dependent oxygenase domain-containing protein [Williamsia sp.]|uniref:isopenicillin N synthase family dioxygenase n=1 Tax=Williamsia sp. TaxID=1872085 RepID=UPI001A20D636|nr:2-oxoglutarate and iron-dependent oxygenase domain-containing protein [Williamsia sp.]MBJ7290897.1 isopenicillin N synthase family oxygenase [Williamsia sp.]